MLIDYVYVVTPAFAAWLRDRHPKVAGALDAAGGNLVGLAIAARGDLDGRMWPNRHILLFPCWETINDVPPQYRDGFDRHVTADSPCLIVDDHPDRLSVDVGFEFATGPIPPQFLLSVSMAAKLGVRFVPVRLTGQTGFMLQLEAASGEEIHADAAALRTGGFYLRRGTR